MLPQREAVVVRYGIVIVGQNPHAEPEYGRLIGPNVMCGMRSTGWGGTEQLRRWRRQGTNYMLTVASSDFVHYQGQSLYQGDSFVRTVLADRNCVGLYLHEVVAYYAQVPQPGDPHRWDWRWAAAQVNYARINRWVEAARARGKVVAWSEPARGWWALNERPEVSPYVWPVFATNFVSATAGDHWREARTSAAERAMSSGAILGESVQSWHFRDQGIEPTRETTLTLCDVGLVAGARFFQVEGRPDDLAWGSPYMQGIADFAASLNGQEKAA
jgi:hypothetical protein